MLPMTHKSCQGISCNSLQKTKHRDFQIYNTWISPLSTIMIYQGQRVRSGEGGRRQKFKKKKKKRERAIDRCTSMLAPALTGEKNPKQENTLKKNCQVLHFCKDY